VTRFNSGTGADTRTDIQKAAMAVGAVFLLVGVLGFVPGITTHYSDMSFGGHHSTAKLLGIFQVSILHNIVHLLFGAAGIAMARQARTAYLYLVGGGVIYLVLWIYGLVIDKDSSANFVPVNAADNWLHFVLGLGMIAVGVLLSRRSAAASTGATRSAR
jgi:4-hydroxybenzoate polyprenyltransferase